MSYKTAYMRCYYPAEWIAACIHIDRDDEDKMAVYQKECDLERIKVQRANVNDSGFDTTVSRTGAICLPLTSIKGVGTMAQGIITEQPFADLRDMANRARPNKGMMAALAEGGALDIFPELKKMGGDTESIMEHWMRTVAERDADEKEAARLARMKYKPKIDVFGGEASGGLGDAGIGSKKTKPVRASKFQNNPFGLDDSFARDLK